MHKKLICLLTLNLLAGNILIGRNRLQLEKNNAANNDSSTTVLTKIISDREKIKNLLKGYKVCSSSLSNYFNAAFIFENKDLDFCVNYASDNSQNLKQRHYHAKINTIGCKSEFTYKTALIFFVEADFNFYDSNKTIKIGPGLSLSLGLEYIHNYFIPIEITFAKFKNAKGGILIIEASPIRNIFWFILDFLTLFRLPIGQHSILDIFLTPLQNIIPAAIRNHLKILGVSLVANGHLTPFEENKATEASAKEANTTAKETQDINTQNIN